MSEESGSSDSEGDSEGRGGIDSGGGGGRVRGGGAGSVGGVGGSIGGANGSIEVGVETVGTTAQAAAVATTENDLVIDKCRRKRGNKSGPIKTRKSLVGKKFTFGNF